MVSNKTGAILKSCYDKDDMSIEVGIDEAGRGPMLGRVYSAAVILPKDDSFKHEMMKDSKIFRFNYLQKGTKKSGMSLNEAKRNRKGTKKSGKGVVFRDIKTVTGAAFVGGVTGEASYG